MEERLTTILEELQSVCDNIRKLGPKRREENLGKQKFKEADVLYTEFELLLENVSSCNKALKLDLAGYTLDLLISEIQSTYKKILGYKVVQTTSDLEFKVTENKSNKMESFNLKTASILIPIMDGKEETVERIIEGIEMYQSCLKGEDSMKLLISFVIKTRLSKTAKLKLKDSYLTVPSLLEDIKKSLLTKKSANSLLSQINNLSQNNMSIAEYGEKLEELFINLTITQADGNQKATEILSPINEKLVIKRFADGLRNRRLSTILAARDYSKLNDAVRAAEDEELARPGTSGQDAVYSYSRGTRGNPRYRRGRGNYYGTQTYRTLPAQSQTGQAHTQRGNRGRYQRPTNGGAYYSNRGYRGQRKNIYLAEKPDEEINLGEFFRAP